MIMCSLDMRIKIRKQYICDDCSDERQTKIEHDVHDLALGWIFYGFQENWAKYGENANAKKYNDRLYCIFVNTFMKQHIKEFVQQEQTQQ